MFITPSKLYNYLQCNHRPWRDVHGNQEEKIEETNPFVQMLWDKGVQHEASVIEKLGSFEDVHKGTLEERLLKTKELMDEGAGMIYQGVIQWKNLRGIPDLLKKLPDGTYTAVDIKSGMAFSGVDSSFAEATEDREEKGEEGKQKKHYAVQLCLYSEILQRTGYAHEPHGMIIDIRGSEQEYDLLSPQGPRTRQTYWELYEEIKDDVWALMQNTKQNKPSLKGACKLCPWYNSCEKWVKEKDDLTGLFYIGQSKRDVLNTDLGVETIEELTAINIQEALDHKKKEKSFLKGIGESTLHQAVRRARVMQEKRPVLYSKPEFPKVQFELFFDIEDDPTQEYVYLHGVYERHQGKERFVDFTAREVSAEAEKKAWSLFWEYIKGLPEEDFAVYYFSHHEHSTYKKMQERYPDVISAAEVEAYFKHPNWIDLYEVTKQISDWPLWSYSLKSLAQYLGFKWRDETPSGALSIQWFNEFIKQKDPALMERLLEYNEDDCKAAMVLKDALEGMEVEDI